jgi:prepilin-type N-terminal cleavage/methylation domain-containing protein
LPECVCNLTPANPKPSWFLECTTADRHMRIFFPTPNQCQHSQGLTYFQAQQYASGFSLLELSLSLLVLGILMATLLPLNAAMENRRRDWMSQMQMDLWMSQIEAFALAHRRLPCPAADADGSEQSISSTGPCGLSNGWLPWRALGLQKPGRAPLYAVASMDTLGTPYSHLLTRQDGFRTVPIDLLSAAIFAAPETSGSSPGTLPALLVSDTAASAGGTHTLTGMPCAGQLFQTVSAVALVSSDLEHSDQFKAGNRCYQPPAIGSQARMAWLSYERLIWLYVKAGLMRTP